MNDVCRVYSVISLRCSRKLTRDYTRGLQEDPMFEAWGRVMYRRRRLTLFIAALGIVFAGVWGTQVFGALSSGNSFTPPDSQSQREQTWPRARSAATTPMW